MSPIDNEAAAAVADILRELRALREQVGHLAGQVAALEGAAAARGPMGPLGVTAPAAEPVPGERLSEEIVLVLCAAVAAFLGKRARVSGIQLVGSAMWEHQGRISIHHSHAFAPRPRSGANS
ncbi:MAG TPA: hypothetical protein VF400_02955 [Anaeromyxobacteraceae bacterium]